MKHSIASFIIGISIGIGIGIFTCHMSHVEEPTNAEPQIEFNSTCTVLTTNEQERANQPKLDWFKDDKYIWDGWKIK